MSNFRWGEAGVLQSIRWTDPYQTTGLFPQARVLDVDGDVVDTIDLDANTTIGYVYEGDHTPANEGEFEIVYDIYESAADRTAGTPKSESISGESEVLKVRRIPNSNPIMAGGGGGAGVSSKDIDNISKKVSEEVWKKVISDNMTAAKILASRSDFNFENDKVMTDLEIPEPKINTRELKSMITDKLTGLTGMHSNTNKKVMGAIKDLDRNIKNSNQENIAVNSKLDNLLSSIDQFGILTNSISEMNKKLASLDQHNILNLTANLQHELGQLASNMQMTEKMIEALNKEDKKRIKALLVVVNQNAKVLQKSIDKVNVKNIAEAMKLMNQ